jgi:superkiller protein 3
MILLVFFFGCASSLPREEAALVYFNLGNAYFELGELEKASQAYLEALRLDKALAGANYNLAYVFIERGNAARGREILFELLETDPDNTIVLNTVAYSFLQEKDPQNALGYYEQVLELNPYNPEALYNSGVILWGLDEIPEARGRFVALYREDPERHDAVYNLGALELEAGNTLKGIEYLEGYLENVADDIDALTLLGGAYAEEEYYSQALTAYNRIIELDPEVPAIHFERARVLLTAIGDYPAGRAALEDAVERGFDLRDPLISLASDPDLVRPEEIRDYLLRNDLLSEENLPAE